MITYEGDAMTRNQSDATRFRALHAPGRLLILPNAWDAGSARLVASCGAEAIATSSAALAWSHGYPDGNALPAAIVEQSTREILRAIDIPLTVDLEAGYSTDPSAVGELAAAVLGAGAAGINLEDGGDSPNLACAKIAAVRRAAEQRGLDVFINARTDVYLRRLASGDTAVAMTIERARRYRDAGCDGIFAPGVAAAGEIRAIVDAIAPLPLNVVVTGALPAAAELRTLGVRRLSAGIALATAALGRARQLVGQFLIDGRSEPFADGAVGFAEMNALFSRDA